MLFSLVKILQLLVSKFEMFIMQLKAAFTVFSEVCFSFPELQVGRVAFDGTNYYIFIFDTIRSPKLWSAVFERPLCFTYGLYFYSQTPEIASGGVLL